METFLSPQSAPIDLFLNSVQKARTNKNVLVREVALRPACVVAGPIISLSSVGYHLFAAGIKVPVVLIKIASRIIPIGRDPKTGKWKSLDLKLPKGFEGKAILLHAYKVAGSVMNIFFCPIAGFSRPVWLIEFNNKLRIEKLIENNSIIRQQLNNKGKERSENKTIDIPAISHSIVEFEPKKEVINNTSQVALLPSNCDQGGSESTSSVQRIEFNPNALNATYDSSLQQPQEVLQSSSKSTLIPQDEVPTAQSSVNLNEDAQGNDTQNADLQNQSPPPAPPLFSGSPFVLDPQSSSSSANTPISEESSTQTAGGSHGPEITKERASLFDEIRKGKQLRKVERVEQQNVKPELSAAQKVASSLFANLDAAAKRRNDLDEKQSGGTQVSQDTLAKFQEDEKDEDFSSGLKTDSPSTDISESQVQKVLAQTADDEDEEWETTPDPVGRPKVNLEQMRNDARQQVVVDRLNIIGAGAKPGTEPGKKKPDSIQNPNSLDRNSLEGKGNRNSLEGKGNRNSLSDSFSALPKQIFQTPSQSSAKENPYLPKPLPVPPTLQNSTKPQPVVTPKAGNLKKMWENKLNPSGAPTVPNFGGKGVPKVKG